MKMQIKDLLKAVTFVLVILSTVNCYGMNVTLQWDPNTETDLAGYKVYYKAGSATPPFDGSGAIEGNSPVPLLLSNLSPTTPEITLSGLDPGLTYSFAVSAYTTVDLEGPVSNVVTLVESVPPVTTIASPTPDAAIKGDANNIYQIAGTVTDNEDSVASVEVSTDDGATYHAATLAFPSWSYNWTLPVDGHYTVLVRAVDGNGNQSITSPLSVQVDKAAPLITLFSVPPVSNSLTVSISGFVATDVGGSGVTHSLISESSTPPTATDLRWNLGLASQFTFTSTGTKTLYAWVKDAAGNVSSSLNGSVTVDITPPTVTAFAIPTTATSLTVPITSFTASDNLGITGYLISAGAATPLATADGWNASAPDKYVLSTVGTKTLYAWAKDAAGNVSSGLSASVTVDLNPPTVTAFAIPTTATSLTVPITSFTASDNLGVVGYLITASATTPLATADGWSASAQSSYAFSAAGTKTIYAWAKDAAGNVSSGLSASVTIDLSPPTVTAFAIPATATSLTVPITSFTASDNLSITGYLITAGAATPLATADGWSATVPTSFSFLLPGTKTLYAWVKDAAGNVSASASATVTITINTGGGSTAHSGDLDGSGGVSLAGAQMTYKFVRGTGQLTDTEKLAADVAPLDTGGKPLGDGMVDTGDVVIMLRRMIGLVNW